jgi:hypothetical protein
MAPAHPLCHHRRAAIIRPEQAATGYDHDGHGQAQRDPRSTTIDPHYFLSFRRLPGAIVQQVMSIASGRARPRRTDFGGWAIHKNRTRGEIVKIANL